MTASFSAGLDRKVVGFDPGWKLTFLRTDTHAVDRDDPIEFTRSNYDATIKVHRSTNFTADTFELSVDGLSDSDFERLADRRYVDIELGWRDIADGAGPLVAALGSMFGTGEGTLYPTMLGRITEVERRAGTYLYRTIFRGMDQVAHRLKCSPGCVAPADGRCAAPPTGLTGPELIDHLVRDVVLSKVHRAGPQRTFDNPPTPDADTSAWENVRSLLARLHPDDENRNIIAFTRRDPDVAVETLHVGQWDPDDPTDRLGGPHPISGSTGLADARPVAADRRDCTTPFADLDAGALDYDLTLLGRADVQPGDEVLLEVDPYTAGPALGSLTSLAGAVGSSFGLPAGGEQSAFDATSIEHTLSPDTGFVTRMRVRPHRGTVTLDDADAVTSDSDEARRAAAVLATRNRALVGLFAEIAFVERQSAATDATHDGQAWDRQRLGLLEGIASSELPDRPVSAPARPEPLPLSNVPYMTPYAWGRTGLVTPHYPGTRVVNLHYRGSSYHPLVAGCLWDDGQEPIDARESDWWLSLPTGVAVPDAGNPAEVEAPDGPASHDLIDGDGRRAIHVSGFVITVGTALMPEVGQRPDDPPDGELHIRHDQSNASIKIDSDGNIEIATDGDLTFRANKIEAHVEDRFEVL